MQPDRPPCIFPECEDEGWYSRGLCRKHYMIASGMVWRRQTTWQDMERKGLVKKANRPGRHKGSKTQDYFLGKGFQPTETPEEKK